MKRMRCHDYLNHATTCSQLYRFVQHLYKAHGGIPSRITINRHVSPSSYQKAADKPTAYEARQAHKSRYASCATLPVSMRAFGEGR